MRATFVLQACSSVLRSYGARGLALRAQHEIRKRLGLFRRRASGRRLPSRCVPIVEIPRTQLEEATDPGSAVARANRVAEGEHQAFRNRWRPLPVGPDDWVRHPESGLEWFPDRAWWRVPHFSAEHGDLKMLWEPARMGWAFDLSRAYVLTGDRRFVETFESYFLDWYESSPPFVGPHWACGQEVAIRAIALVFAESLLPLDRSRDAVAEILRASAERIVDGLGYAVSQRNNHAVSEAAGLIVIGARCREGGPWARAWLDYGQRILERSILEQIAADGWYIQHSFQYLRVALQQCVVAEMALRSIDRRLSDQAVERLRAGVDLLCAAVEGGSGRMPNYGANDGSLVLPTTLAPYRDFRPVLTAVCALWRIPLPEDIPADDETLAWIGEPAPPTAPPRRDGVESGVSGWAMVRTGRTDVFLRAGRYNSRPGHDDPLHLCVRMSGKEIVVDPGTYLYSAPEPWRNGLAGGTVHNGPRIAGRPSGVRGPRFLWLRWPGAELEGVLWKENGEAVLTAVGHHGVRRTVHVEDGRVTVVDEAPGVEVGRLKVCWVLGLGEDRSVLETTPPGRWCVGRPEHVVGWHSPHYGERLSTLACEVETELEEHGSIVTVIRV